MSATRFFWCSHDASAKDAIVHQTCAVSSQTWSYFLLCVLFKQPTHSSMNSINIVCVWHLYIGPFCWCLKIFGALAGKHFANMCSWCSHRILSRGIRIWDFFKRFNELSFVTCLAHTADTIEHVSSCVLCIDYESALIADYRLYRFCFFWEDSGTGLLFMSDALVLVVCIAEKILKTSDSLPENLTKYIVDTHLQDFHV